MCASYPGKTGVMHYQNRKQLKAHYISHFVPTTEPAIRTAQQIINGVSSMPRRKQSQNNLINWNLVNVKPDSYVIESIKKERAKTDFSVEQLIHEILSREIKIAISLDEDNDCVIVSVTPKGVHYQDLKTTFIFRSNDVTVLLWVVLYYATNKAWNSLADRPHTDHWQM